MEKLVNMVPYSDSPRGGVQSQVDALNSSLAKLYPVGSIYISVNDTNPGTFFGGTWKQIYGQFLVGTDTDPFDDDGAGEEFPLFMWERIA